MKIQCPNCKKITELEHADRGSQVECVCSFVFAVNDQTIVEEFTEVDSKLPERIGQYKVTGFIGIGGMGKIYLGEHPNLGIPVAIKTLRIEYMTDEASCERFVQSAKICARISHPNIVRVYDCGYENGNVYLVMEYITNGSAQTLLDQEGKLDPEYAAFIMMEVCSGLMEAEKHGIVHRDIKPENIMFDQEGTVKILDLGLSKIIGDDRLGKESITASLTALGTPLYMAPEQAVDAANCDSRADIYSIGVTLYQLCTGKLPFDSADPHELRRMHALEKPVPPRQLVPELMPDLQTIILRCMEKKREDRYATIADLALDLEAYLKNRVLPSTISQTPLLQQDPVRKHGAEGSLPRRIRYLWVAYFRQIPRPMRRMLLGGLIAAAVLSAAVLILMRASDRPVQVKRTPAPITAEKILTALARQAAGYLPDQDYGPVVDLYRNYRGSLEEETRAARLRIANGYQLTQRQAVADLQSALAELLLQGNYEFAMESFQKRHGPNLCPECRRLLRELVNMPRLFQSYWQDRRGQEVDLAFLNGGRIPLRINDADQFEVYAVRTDTRRQVRFRWDDLTLDEQLKIVGRSGSLRHFRTGYFLLRQGKPELAAEAFEQVPVLGRTLAGLVRSGFDPQGSGRDSDRSR